PSLSENFGIAAAEALLSGLPCVLGRGVAIAQQVQEAGAGIVVSPEPDAIARALVDLLTDGDRRRAISERAHTFALKEYSSQVMTNRLIKLYERLAETRGSGVQRSASATAPRLERQQPCHRERTSAQERMDYRQEPIFR